MSCRCCCIMICVTGFLIRRSRMSADSNLEAKCHESKVPVGFWVLGATCTGFKNNEWCSLTTRKIKFCLKKKKLRTFLETADFADCFVSPDTLVHVHLARNVVVRMAVDAASENSSLARTFSAVRLLPPVLVTGLHWFAVPVTVAERYWIVGLADLVNYQITKIAYANDWRCAVS